MEDLAISNTILISGIRYFAYFLLVLSIGKRAVSRKKLINFTVTLLISALISIVTRDIYYGVILVLILASNNIDDKRVMEYSYKVLCVLTLITIALSLVGIIPLVVTNRILGNTGTRYGMGFYHSNVLPAIIFYLYSYRVMIEQEKIRIGEVAAWTALSILIYKLCLSRNALFCCVLLTLFVLCSKSKRVKEKKPSKILYRSSFAIIIILPILLLITMIFQGNNILLLYNINKSLSGRLAIAYHQYEITGLKLINFMSKDSYQAVARIIDSGYLYVALRYGLLFLIFYVVIQYKYVKKYQFTRLALCVILIVVLENAIDNDLFSYGFLPYILIAFSKSKSLCKTSDMSVDAVFKKKQRTIFQNA
jgi:hypothetical protein